MKISKITLDEVQIGEITVAHLPAALSRQERLDETNMLIGLDFFSFTLVRISNSPHTLVMQSPPYWAHAGKP